MVDEDRERFDALVEEAIGELPETVQGWIQEVPVVVLDGPTAAMLDDLSDEPFEHKQLREQLCGLHTGVSLTDRSIEVPEAHALNQIHLFRVGILNHAAGWDWQDESAQKRLSKEIRITLLHELGHQFGLDEDELEELGYA